MIIALSLTLPPFPLQRAAMVSCGVAALLALSAFAAGASAQTPGASLSDGCIMADSERIDSWDHEFGLSAETCEGLGFCWAVHDTPGCVDGGGGWRAP